MDQVNRAREFIQMADADGLAVAQSDIPYSICFHAQQSIEKSLKAFLVFHGQAIPKTHDIGELIRRCAVIDSTFGEMEKHAELLNLFGVEIRYQPSKTEAESKCSSVFSAFLEIRKVVREKLPPEVTEDKGPIA